MATARQCVKELIDQNINCRRLVIVGRFVKLEEFLYDNGLKCEFHVSLKPEEIDGINVKNISEIKGKCDEYYVVYVNQLNDAFNTLMKEYGYERITDYCGLQEMNKCITDSSNYYDSFGNKCNYCPPNMKIIFCGINAKVIIEESVKCPEWAQVEVHSNGILKLGKDSLITGNVVIYDNSVINIGEKCVAKFKIVQVCGELKIGNYTTFTGSTEIIVSEEKIIIGEDCMIALNCILYCGNGHSIYDVNTGKRISNGHSIVLRNHIWIGQRAILLSPLLIDSGSIVGAGSVVKGKYPNNCVIAGNPARKKKNDVFWSREMRKEIRENEKKYWKCTDENSCDNSD